jgi:hypothetical protein
MRSGFGQVLHPWHQFLCIVMAAKLLALPSAILAGEEQNAEAALRALVQANA